MKKVRWVSATAGAALVAAMFALPGAGVAYASACMPAGGLQRHTRPVFSLLLVPPRNRLAQALYRVELRMCGLGV